MDEYKQKQNVCFLSPVVGKYKNSYGSSLTFWVVFCYLWLENRRTVMEIRLLFGYVFFQFLNPSYYFVRNLHTLMCAKLLNLIDIDRSINRTCRQPLPASLCVVMG
jgi:hypothetical protein